MDGQERAKRFTVARTELNQNGPEGKMKVYQVTGVPSSAIVAYENPNSTRSLNVGFVEKLADHYGVNAAWLLGQSESWSRDVEVAKVCEMTGLSAEAYLALRGLMQDDQRRAFINAFLASEEFSGMVFALQGMRRGHEDQVSAAPVEYADVLCEHTSTTDLVFSEGDFEDMRIWKASRSLEKVMRNLIRE